MKEVIRPVFVGAENIPDEIWVIQINPTAVESLPKTNSQIFDRRNQMEGNVLGSSVLKCEAWDFSLFCRSQSFCYHASGDVSDL